MRRSPKSVAPSAARITRRCCMPSTRSRRCCKKIPSYARRSTDLSRASSCDPQRARVHQHARPQPRRRSSIRHAAVFLSPPLSTPLDDSYHYAVVFFFFLTRENYMEVVLDRDQFLKGLQMVHNIVEPRQTLPILANV